MKGKIKFPKPINPPGPNESWIKIVGGIKWIWIPNPTVKNRGYWRRSLI